jgi:ATP-dependent DNA helicase DinG
MTSSCLTPYDLGLPPKFASWRPGQESAIFTIVESDRRFIAGAYPTGTGKSVVAVGSGLMNGGRTVIETSTKLLCEQYCGDFPSITEMRGQSNFPCHESKRRNATCVDGRAESCPARREGDCPYILARNRFLGSSLGVTNYDYALSSTLHGDGIGPIDLLVLDEAHSAVQQLSDALTISFKHWDLHPIYLITGYPPIGESITKWQSWSLDAAKALRERFGQDNDGSTPEILPHLEQFKSSLSRLKTVDDTWVTDHTEKESQFSPLWPTKYAKSVLFGGAKKVLLISATIVPKTLALLDVSEQESLFLTQSYHFPPHRSPVYLFGAHFIDYRSTDSQWAETIGRMDTLISRRLDRKGIIHSVSYDRQKFIYDNSEHRSIMLTPSPRTLPDAVTEFRRAKPPKLLVSPALTTGYDFPGEDCEFQIIIKLPFVDTRGGVMKARVEQDPEYGNYLTAQQLTQMCGRPMRSEEDQCENFILDRHAEWFFKERKMGRNGKMGGGYRHLFPEWFLKLVRWCDGPPRPPEALRRMA